MLEIDFSSCRDSSEFFYSWRVKEFQGNEAMGLVPTLHCPARLDAETTVRVQRIALCAHRALGCADFSRTDIRLSADGVPYVLEINPLPGLSPLDSNFPVMTSAAGLSHHALIRRIVDLSMSRHRTTSRAHPRPAPVRYGTADQAGRVGREGEVPPRKPPGGIGLAVSRVAP